MKKYFNAFESESDLEKSEIPKVLDLTVLQEKANIIRSKPPINWQPFLNGSMITSDHHFFLTVYQAAQTKEKRDEVLSYYQDGAFSILATVVPHVSLVEDNQKFLVLIDDMICEDKSRLQLFKPALAESWKAFLNLLTCYEPFVRNIAARLISKFICEDIGLSPEASELIRYLTWLKDELRNDNKYILSVARCIQRILKINKYRLPFFNIHGIFRIIQFLVDGTQNQEPGLVRGNKSQEQCWVNGTQIQYQLIFCIWLSSFVPEIAEKLDTHPTIPVLADLLSSCQSKNIKLPRVIIATFRNLLEKPPTEEKRSFNALLMIRCNLMTSMKNLEIDNDLEFLENVEAVEEILGRLMAKLTTFDEYRLQVISGSLEWSVVHTREQFWKENAGRLNENQYDLLKKLISLLETSQEDTVLSVAAHDLGKYMRHYSRGKHVVEELGGKNALLALLGHENDSVKYQVLRSLQILMIDTFHLPIEHQVTDSDQDTDSDQSE